MPLAQRVPWSKSPGYLLAQEVVSSIFPVMTAAWSKLVSKQRVAGYMPPKFAIGEYGHCALVIDTEGNCIGLHSMN